MRWTERLNSWGRFGMALLSLWGVMKICHGSLESYGELTQSNMAQHVEDPDLLASIAMQLDFAGDRE